MKTINFDFDISGTTITIPFSAICTVSKKEFRGDVNIEYRNTKKALEYIDAEHVIKQLTENITTAEELCHNIFLEAKQALGNSFIKILVDVQSSEAHQPVQVWIEQKEEQ